MMNKKVATLVFLVCGMIAAALILRNGELMLLAIPFLVYLTLGVLQAPGELSLVAERSMDKTSLTVGQLVETHLVIQNRDKELRNLYLVDGLYPAMTLLEGQEWGRISLAQGEIMELAF